MKLHLDGKTAYVANLDEGLWVIDITDPKKPSKITALKDGLYMRIILSRDGKTVFGGTDSLIIVDVSTRDSPK